MKTNLNRAGFLTLILVLSFFSTPALAQGGMKIGVVDIDAVFVTCNMGKALFAQLEDFQKAAEAEAKPKIDQIIALEKEMTEKRATLSQEKLSGMNRQIQDLKIELKRLQDDKTKEFETKKNLGFKEIEKKLKPVMEAIRDQDGYDMIFHKPGVVLIEKESYNITKLVIDRLNAAK